MINFKLIARNDIVKEKDEMWMFLEFSSPQNFITRSKIIEVQDPDQKIKTETEKKKQKIEISGRAEIPERQ